MAKRKTQAEKIAALEKEVAELKVRIAILEKAPPKLIPYPVPKQPTLPRPNPEPWRFPHPWHPYWCQTNSQFGAHCHG